MTVEFLLCVRAAYLANGGSPLKHWDQIQNRMLSASRRAVTADEWTSLVCRGLQLPALQLHGAVALHDLCFAVRESAAASRWLDMIQREYGLLMAMARLCAEQRAAERTATEDA
jgi:gamma-glutamyl:cysteine ligase YbdK (ATP-grasp superfamily)